MWFTRAASESIPSLPLLSPIFSPTSTPHSFTLHLPLPCIPSPQWCCSLSPALPAFILPLSPSLPLLSKGPNCDRNSNNAVQLCANSLSLSLHTHILTSTHTHFCCQFTNPFSHTWPACFASPWQSKDHSALLRCCRLRRSVIAYFICFNECINLTERSKTSGIGGGRIMSRQAMRITKNDTHTMLECWQNTLINILCFF